MQEKVDPEPDRRRMLIQQAKYSRAPHFIDLEPETRLRSFFYSQYNSKNSQALTQPQLLHKPCYNTIGCVAPMPLVTWDRISRAEWCQCFSSSNVWKLHSARLLVI
jgi:hypothetical protein